jgi:hypothetical protein
LELLEGVVAFLAGRKDEARKLLMQSQDKWKQLQVSDTSLAMLLNMGFSTTQVRRHVNVKAGDLESSWSQSSTTMEFA